MVAPAARANAKTPARLADQKLSLMREIRTRPVRWSLRHTSAPARLSWRDQGALYRPLLSKELKPMDIRLIVSLSKLPDSPPSQKSRRAKRSRNGAPYPPKSDFLLSARGIGGSLSAGGGISDVMAKCVWSRVFSPR
jgi:hypothetical protein